MYPREQINFIQTWIFYFEDDKVYIQDCWIFEEQFPALILTI